MVKHAEDKFEIKWDAEKKKSNLRKLVMTEKNILIDSSNEKQMIANQIGNSFVIRFARFKSEEEREKFEQTIFNFAEQIKMNFGVAPNSYLLGYATIVESTGVTAISYYRCY